MSKKPEVLELRNRGYSYTQIARKAGIPLGTVKGWCHRAGVKAAPQNGSAEYELLPEWMILVIEAMKVVDNPSSKLTEVYTAYDLIDRTVTTEMKKFIARHQAEVGLTDGECETCDV